jgi:hypothetical protein
MGAEESYDVWNVFCLATIVEREATEKRNAPPAGLVDEFGRVATQGELLEIGKVELDVLGASQGERIGFFEWCVEFDGEGN